MKSRQYVHAPLIETVCELRFRPEPSLECNWDRIYELFRKGFPEIGPVVLGQWPLRRFTREDGLEGVFAAADRIAYFTMKYPGFEGFKAAGLKHLKAFAASQQVSGRVRVGLRYVNRIPIAKTGETLPLDDFLKIKIERPGPLGEPIQVLDLAFVVGASPGRLTTRIASQAQPDAILLDFDYSEEQEFEVGALSRFLDRGHKQTKAVFESLLTDGYRKFLEAEN